MEVVCRSDGTRIGGDSKMYKGVVDGMRPTATNEADGSVQRTGPLVGWRRRTKIHEKRATKTTPTRKATPSRWFAKKRGTEEKESDTEMEGNDGGYGAVPHAPTAAAAATGGDGSRQEGGGKRMGEREFPITHDDARGSQVVGYTNRLFFSCYRVCVCGFSLVVCFLNTRVVACWSLKM